MTFQVDIFEPAINNFDIFIIMVQICKCQTHVVLKIMDFNLAIFLLQPFYSKISFTVLNVINHF